PDVGLSTHIADVIAAIEGEQLSNVVLVGHSYGGMVITGVADRVPASIAHLVYLDTFVPEARDSMQSVAPLGVGVVRIQARISGEGWRVEPPPGEDFGVTEEPDRSWVKRSLTAQSLKTFVQPLTLADAAIVSRFPRTHIYCGGRGRLAPLVQRAFM